MAFRFWSILAGALLVLWLGQLGLLALIGMLVARVLWRQARAVAQ